MRDANLHAHVYRALRLIIESAISTY